MAFQPGSGLQIQQALWREGRPVFAGQGYADLSETCLHYIGGILHHARALNAFTNPTTNSYRRLVQGGGAPRQLAYAALNRSAAIRLPFAATARGQAGRGALRRPGRQPLPRVRRAADGRARRHRRAGSIRARRWTATSTTCRPRSSTTLPTVCATLAEALDALDRDRGFLTADEVFTDDLIDAYIALKRAEIEAVERRAPPGRVPALLQQLREPARCLGMPPGFSGASGPASL